MKKLYIESFLSSGQATHIVNEDETDFDSLRDLIEKLIEKLPPKRKEVFKLSRFEGYTYKNGIIMASSGSKERILITIFNFSYTKNREI